MLFAVAVDINKCYLVDELVEKEDADTDDHIGHQHSQGGHQLNQHGCGDWGD